jgi:hypothetical protein
MMTLWRLTVRPKAPTSPGGTFVLETRAPSQQMALDRIATYRPDVEILTVERRPTAA